MLHTGALGDPAGTAGHLEHAGEVAGLAGVGDIDHPAGAITLRDRREAVADRGQVGGGVVEAAIALLHDQGQRLAVLAAHPLQKHATGTVIHHQQAGGLEVVDHRLQVGVVEGFAALAEGDLQPVVDLLELAPALVAEQPPGPERQRIAALQLHHLLPGSGLEGLVVVEAGLGLAVEGHQIAQIHCIGRFQGRGRHLLEVGDQHAELGAPVAHVVEAQHWVAAKLQHPRQAVADDRGAQVPHVHLLGDVGAGEVHDHRRRRLAPRVLGGSGHPQARIREPFRHLGREPLGPQGEVDEAGAGDHRLQAELREGRIGRQLLHDRLGDLAGRLPQGLGQGQGAIGLEVAELRLAGRCQLGIEGLGRSGQKGLFQLGLHIGLFEGPLHRRAQLGFQEMGDAQHGEGRLSPRSSPPTGAAWLEG